MRFDRKSADYQANMEAFEDMDLYIPMTRTERNALRSWARRGYDVETNPWGYTDCDGWPLNYLQAYRLKNGYSPFKERILQWSVGLLEGPCPTASLG